MAKSKSTRNKWTEDTNKHGTFPATKPPKRSMTIKGTKYKNPELLGTRERGDPTPIQQSPKACPFPVNKRLPYKSVVLTQPKFTSYGRMLTVFAGDKLVGSNKQRTKVGIRYNTIKDVTIKEK